MAETQKTEAGKEPADKAEADKVLPAKEAKPTVVATRRGALTLEEIRARGLDPVPFGFAPKA